VRRLVHKSRVGRMCGSTRELETSHSRRPTDGRFHEKGLRCQARRGGRTRSRSVPDFHSHSGCTLGFVPIGCCHLSFGLTSRRRRQWCQAAFAVTRTGDPIVDLVRSPAPWDLGPGCLLLPRSRPSAYAACAPALGTPSA
jgi:hypothetical protein